ncbi:hypothetical protein K501DRAFT_237726 [Backusella circina FSU 941]|nr:hypothetical protein K501DRAFT_237726 [Backusella circina FSU 941]
MTLTKVYIVNKVTCPFENCKAIFDADTELTKQCTFTECYECHRGFCMACINKWHPGEIRIINDTNATLQTLEIAKKNNWIRCPRCKRFVQKISGCHAVLCPCGSSFCYRCGSKTNDHICLRNCDGFSNTQLIKEKEHMYTL